MYISYVLLCSVSDMACVRYAFMASVSPEGQQLSRYAFRMSVSPEGLQWSRYAFTISVSPEGLQYLAEVVVVSPCFLLHVV